MNAGLAVLRAVDARFRPSAADLADVLHTDVADVLRLLTEERELTMVDFRRLASTYGAKTVAQSLVDAAAHGEDPS